MITIKIRISITMLKREMTIVRQLQDKMKIHLHLNFVCDQRERKRKNEKKANKGEKSKVSIKKGLETTQRSCISKCNIVTIVHTRKYKTS